MTRQFFRNFGDFARSLSRLPPLAVMLGLGLAGCGATTVTNFSAPEPPTAAAYQGGSAEELVVRIEKGDASEDARRALRTHGPDGLHAALVAYDAAKARGADPAILARLSDAADTAAQQRDSVASRLYWYTDLDEAKRVAKRENKPILSLRMLGHLDEELSCANSRFFRTTLYPDPQVNARLAKDFVLHWSSERPAPIVTIDYRDGRVVKRTITGNSIHYVLDADGHVVDAIPGLYSPKIFADSLTLAHEAAMAKAASPSERDTLIADFHQSQLERARSEWAIEARKVGYSGDAPAAGPSKGPSPALIAIPVAATKAMVEMPIARAIDVEFPKADDLGKIPWTKIGSDLRPQVRVSREARALMREKAPLDWSSGAPKALDQAGFDALVDKFEEHVAEDTARNEFFFHAQIRKWIAADPDITLAKLNERVYSELFLTPANDPWLGLVPPVVYSGIQGDGFAPARP